jgi:uncharacterized protein (DUF1330 family)
MAATMIVSMDLRDDGWTADYFIHVPALLTKYGGRQLSGGRRVEVLEGQGPPPDRLAVFEFPDTASAHRFMADPRYQPYAMRRQGGSESQIYLFENELTDGAIV